VFCWFICFVGLFVLLLLRLYGCQLANTQTHPGGNHTQNVIT